MIQTRGCRTNLVSATAPFVYSLKQELYTVTATTTTNAHFLQDYIL